MEGSDMPVSNTDREIFREVKDVCVALSRVAFLPEEAEGLETFKPYMASRLLTEPLVELNKILDQEIRKRAEEANGDRVFLNHKLGNYIMTPLIPLIQRGVKLEDRQIEVMFKILELLTRNCWYYPSNTSPATFPNLFGLIEFYISGGVSEVSADTNMAGMRLILALLESALNNPMDTYLRQDKTLPMIAKLIIFALDSSLVQNALQLQLDSLKVLHVIFTQVLFDGEVVWRVLPGCVSKLHRLAAQKGGIQTHYQVLVSTIDLLRVLVTNVFDDLELGVVDTREKSITDLDDLVRYAEMTVVAAKDQDPNMPLKTETDQVVITVPGKGRDQEWLKQNTDKITAIFPFITGLATHRRPEVRLKLFEFCRDLTVHCSRSLHKCMYMLADCLSVLSSDPVLAESISSWLGTNATLRSVIQERLNLKLSGLPASLSLSNQEKIVEDLNSLSFYIQNSSKKNDVGFIEAFADLLFRGLGSLVGSETTTKRFKNRNIQVVSNPTNDLVMIQRNVKSADFEDKNLNLLGNFYDAAVEGSLATLLESLGANSFWINRMTEFLIGRTSNQNSTALDKSLAMWIINSMIHGFVKARDNPKDSIDDFINIEDTDDGHDNDLEILKSQTMYDLLDFADQLLQEVSERSPDLVVSMEQSIAIDTIAGCALVLKEQFKDELIDYLYPVIDSLASSSDQIRAHAQRASITIADQCYDGSLRSLIYNNCDYLVDSLSLKLTSDSLSPRTSAVLLVLITIGGFDIISQLSDVIQTMFTLLDLYHGYDVLSEGFFVVFDSVIEQVHNGYLSEYDFSKVRYNVANYKKPWGMHDLKQVRELLDKKNRDLAVRLDDEKIELVKHPNKPFGEAPDSDDEEEYGNDDELSLMKEVDEYQLEKQRETEKKWDSHIPTDLYFMIQRMASYGDRLILSTDSIRLQARILDVFKKVFPILSTSESNLLPILADMWPLVLKLCVDDDIRVVSSAVGVAYTMIDFGGDFMSKKFNELWISIRDESKLFKDYSKILAATNSDKKSAKLQRFEENVNFKTYQQLVQLLALGIKKLGTTLPNNIVREIIRHSIIIVPDTRAYGYYSDVAWFEKFQRPESFIEQAPKAVKLGGDKEFIFHDYV